MKTKALRGTSAVVVLAFTLSFCVGEGESPRILRPLDKSVLPPGPTEIAMVIPPSTAPLFITLDGEKLTVPSCSAGVESARFTLQQLATGVYLPPAFVLVRSLSPGSHELRVGGATSRFFVREEDDKTAPPKDWPQYTPHPPPTANGVTCSTCHALDKEQRFTNMAASIEIPITCFDCHERSEFSLIHNHRYESIALCQMCHDPHGATADHLLKMPQKKACTLCHD